VFKTLVVSSDPILC